MYARCCPGNEVKAFKTLESAAAPFLQPNIDTDQIIPARFLQKPRSGGFGQYLFHDLRFDVNGAERPEFALNQPHHRDARVVVANVNFGCGSSRENAVWALSDYGRRWLRICWRGSRKLRTWRSGSISNRRLLRCRMIQSIRSKSTHSPNI